MRLGRRSRRHPAQPLAPPAAAASPQIGDPEALRERWVGVLAPRGNRVRTEGGRELERYYEAEALADKLLGLDADADCRGYGAGPSSRGGNSALSESGPPSLAPVPRSRPSPRCSAPLQDPPRHRQGEDGGVESFSRARAPARRIADPPPLARPRLNDPGRRRGGCLERSRHRVDTDRARGAAPLESRGEEVRQGRDDREDREEALHVRGHAPLLPGKSEHAGGSLVSCELRCPLAASRPSSVATNFDRAGGAWPRRTGPKCVRVRGPSRMKIPARSVGRTAGRSLPRPGRPARHLPSVETDTLPPRKSRMRKGFPSTRGCLFLETVPRETSPTEYGGRTPTEDATAA